MSNYQNLVRDLEEVQYQMKELKKKISNFDKEEYYTEEDFKNEVDDTEPIVEIFGATFFAGDILSKLDPIAFSCAYSKFVDSMDNENFEEYKNLLNELDDLQCQMDDLQEMIDDLCVDDAEAI